MNAIDRVTDGEDGVWRHAGAEPRNGRRRVFVRGLELIGSIGIYEHEKRYEQRIVVSLELDVHDHYDGRSDRIGDVYDYDDAIALVKDIVANGHVHLLETLAERIAAGCLDSPSVMAVTVTVEKPDVLPSCRAVGIEIVRRRPLG